MTLGEFRSILERPEQAHVVYVSPWEYDFIGLVNAGKPPYLARLRADLNQRRRREAAPAGDPGSIWAIDRSVAG